MSVMRVERPGDGGGGTEEPRADAASNFHTRQGIDQAGEHGEVGEGRVSERREKVTHKARHRSERWPRLRTRIRSRNCRDELTDACSSGSSWRGRTRVEPAEC